MQVREAQLAQYNYILVVGEEEAKTGQVRSNTICGRFWSGFGPEPLVCQPS